MLQGFERIRCRLKLAVTRGAAGQKCGAVGQRYERGSNRKEEDTYTRDFEKGIESGKPTHTTGQDK